MRTHDSWLTVRRSDKQRSPLDEQRKRRDAVSSDMSDSTLPPPLELLALDRPDDDEARQQRYDAIKRAMRRLLSEPVDEKEPKPRGPKLPNWKSRFPRMLCLDMNQWIYLAQAHYGKQPRPDAVAALPLIRRYVDAGRLIVPIASVNLLEAVEVGNPGRRERLARFMVELSTNLSIVNHDNILSGECQTALMRKYKMEACFPIRSQLVHPGIAPVFGIGVRMTSENEDFNRLYGAIQESPEMSESFLAYGAGSSGSRADREIDKKALRIFTEIRRLDGALPIDERRRLEIANAFAEGHIADILYKAADNLDIPREHLRDWLTVAENRETLHACIPSCHVVLELIVAAARNSDDVNDLKDYGFLKVVIPYANYVVTEKSWTHLLDTTGVARKYDTVVVGSLGELAERLKADLGDLSESE
jgi:hypothetical protein